jgi:hypothetical protein
MKLSPDQTDVDSLSRFGEELVQLLIRRDFVTVANRFGYALAYGRELTHAIESDFNALLSDYNSGPENSLPKKPSIIVKYFQPNDSNLFAIVECVFFASVNCSILAELIVTTKEQDMYASLEDISLAS